MLQIAYDRMRWIVSGNDRNFNAIKAANDTEKTIGNVRGAMEVSAWADKAFAAQVCQDCGWDLKREFRSAFKSGSTNLYFSLGGDSDSDIAYSVFGNILFGYVGLAAGFSEQELLDKAFLEDFAADPKGANNPDIEAYKIGFELWKRYGAGLTKEQLDAAIRDLAKQGKVHTRKTIREGTFCAPGVVAAAWPGSGCFGRTK
jgi:hypothetical protein